MKIRLMFQDSPYLSVHCVSVLGSFNGYDEKAGTMERERDGWVTELSLTPGEHYYKFLVNQEFLLNDPQANIYLPHVEDELWSVIIINEQDQQLFSNEQYGLHIDSYAVTSIQTDLPVAVNKKTFHLGMDGQLVTRFGFTDIKGLHCISALWFDARGQFFDYSENMLFQEEDSPDDPVYLWFWLPLQETGKEYPEGLWTLKLFINGSYVLEDQYTLTRSSAYTAQGRLFGTL
ncbi:hypothetical protein [Faecalispora anaeroviscerum]|uniref:hypothetical protein n=1 Tax=Faecalispora anaeroviscerum TaxID=2991836 RepID=UPI0024B9F156|nr:hypothetical protein [Faecalispora anaeroviscerum]